jgi:molybdenum cofactor guanylyltransferase
MSAICIVGVSGYSGSGKTTLIERVLPELKKQGFSTGVIKHIHHNLTVDIEGKDTERFFRAGADHVFAHDAEQSFLRSRYLNEGIHQIIARLPSGLDLILVEGHKDLPLPGIWLEAGLRRNKPAAAAGEKEVIFRDDPDYIGQVLSVIHRRLVKFHSDRIIRAGLLVGGKSVRMGRPKSLLETEGITLAERSFRILSGISRETLLLGSGDIPESLNTAGRLPDVAGLTGPLAGMLSAFRWAPESAWVISSVDMPLMHRNAWKWLLEQRKPGIWAVLPKIRGSKGVETTGAVYEPMIAGYLESMAEKASMKLQKLALHPKVLTPEIPDDLTEAWKNVNTSWEWEAICRAERSN